MRSGNNSRGGRVGSQVGLEGGGELRTTPGAAVLAARPAALGKCLPAQFNVTENSDSR